MMKKILMYGHGGAYNHGAEAIVRASVPVFRQAGCPLLLSTHFPDQDREFGLDRMVDKLIPADLSLVPEERAAEGLAARERIAAKIYRDALAEIDKDTICIGIGGDNYCYPNWHRQSVFHRTAKARGGKSVLWGCSIEPDRIHGDMERILSEHDRIYVRESLTAAALREHGIEQVAQIRDPAFSLRPEPVPLPEKFGEHTAALNLSPLALRRSAQLLYHFVEAARWLLSHADALLMLPHVTMPVDDDRQALEELERRLPPSERARVCWAPEGLSAGQYKCLISKCEILVCCRTHASIAAYSTGVPVVVAGYSVKSRGISLDMGLERWVVPIENGSELTSRVTELWNHTHTAIPTPGERHTLTEIL